MGVFMKEIGSKKPRIEECRRAVVVDDTILPRNATFDQIAAAYRHYREQRDMSVPSGEEDPTWECDS